MRSGWVLVLMAAAACGDNTHVRHGVDASDLAPIDAAPALTGTVVAGGTSGGTMAAMDIATLSMTQGLDSHHVVGADPVLRHLGHELFAINRGGDDTVSVLDQSDLSAAPEAFAPGASSQPRDVAIANGKLYVATFGDGGVHVFDRATHAATLIALPADDPDGVPNCVSAIAVGTEIYVACALLDDTQPSKPPRGLAKVYVIDSGTDTVRTSFELTTPNPVSLFEQVGDGTIAISTADPTNGFAGCVEHVTTGDAPSSLCLARNVLFGGYATRLQFQPLVANTFMWMSVTGTTPGSPPPQLMAYDVYVSELWPVISTPGEAIGDVGLCPDGSLVLSELTASAPGLRVYQLASEVTTTPLAIGMPPTSPHGIECY